MRDVTADTRAPAPLAVALADRPRLTAATGAVPAARPDRPHRAAAGARPRPAVTGTHCSARPQDPRCELTHRGSWCSDTRQA